MNRLRSFCLFCLVAASCRAEPKPPAPAVRHYLEEVIGILQAHSLNRTAINWVALKQQVLAKASGATTIEQAYPAVEAALMALGERHSMFVPARLARRPPKPTDKQPPLHPDEPVPEDIGYIRIPWVVGSPQQLNEYITTVQARIRERDTPALKGWIVDLRGNMGGNMWPMLAGVGPILGEDTLGYCFDSNNVKTAWRYEKGKALADGDVEAEAATYYTLKVPNPVVAVLTDTLTASSGEAVAVTFKGRQHTRSFGAGTSGVSTARNSFYLSDGSVLLLTTAVFADRRQVRYGHSLAPDERLRPAEVVPRAVQWIRAEYEAQP